MGGAKSKAMAMARAAKKAVNVTNPVPHHRPRKAPAFNMAMALRIREGLNINPKPLQEGQGSLPVLRYIEPSVAERDFEKAVLNGSDHGLSGAKDAKAASSTLVAKPEAARPKFMSIQELNEKILASHDTEAEAEAEADGVRSVNEDVDRAGLPTLEQYMKDDVLFVSIDTEMVIDPEQSRHGLTEVGMCLLDTRDLRQLGDFGVRGDNAIDLFDPHQFGLYNNATSIDDADISSAQARIRSRSYKYIKGRAAVKWISSSRIEREMSKVIYHKLGRELSRKIIFLYFDTRSDMQFLRLANVSLTEEFPNSEVVDTQMVGAAAVIAWKTGHPRAPAAMVYDHLGVPTVAGKGNLKPGHVANKLHNAGNDAVFQMQAWTAGLCLKDKDWAALHRGEKLWPKMNRAWERTPARQLHVVSDDLEQVLEIEEKAATV